MIGSTPTSSMPSMTSRAMVITRSGSSPNDAVADHVVRALAGEVDHRRRAAVDGELGHDGAHRLRREPHGALGEVEVLPRERAEGTEAAEARPLAVVEPLNAAALLVDEHRRIGPADGLPELRAEPPDLVRIVEIAPEQEEPIGVRVAEEGGLVGGELVPRRADEEGKGRAGHGYCPVPESGLTRSRP